MKSILVLGAGMVAAPIVDHLLNSGYKITVTGIREANIQRLVKGKENASGKIWNVDDEEGLRELIIEHDLVVSLLPYTFHIMVAKNCIDLKKSMITASYVSEEMHALDSEAREAGILILNEMGLDPGIDHMSAMRIIDNVHGRGGKIEKFFSLCGALVTPESADNPFRYKFSWSPKGTILASRNSARYLKDNKEINVSSKNLYKDIYKLDFPGVGSLVVYPNRDSIQYIDLYGIPEVKTMFRGTLRLPGWCSIIDRMKELNMFGEEKIKLTGKTYADIMAGLTGETDSKDIKQKTAAFLDLEPGDEIIEALDWLGAFSDQQPGSGEKSVFDVFSELMIEKMSMNDDDQDMVVLQHSFRVSYPGGKNELVNSRILDYGSPKTYTSVARTVALPAAMAAILILEGKIGLKGVYRPLIPEIYDPVLDMLKDVGIRVEETYGLKEDNDLF